MLILQQVRVIIMNDKNKMPSPSFVFAGQYWNSFGVWSNVKLVQVHHNLLIRNPSS